MARQALVPLLILVATIAGAQEPLDGAYDSGFEFTTSERDFTMRLFSAIQFRHTYMWFDDRVLGNERDYSNFYMRRARLWWKGHAFDPRFTYYFHIQLEPTRTVNAHDIWLEYSFGDLLKVGVGRNKIAYGLEFLNSGFGLSFVDRSVMYGETDIDFLLDDGPGYPGGGTERFALTWHDPDTDFATGGMTLYRSQGIQLRGHRGSETGPTWEYQAGVWQGRSTFGLANPDNKHLYSLRAGYHPFGWIDWTRQGDGRNSQHYKLSLFVSAYANSSTVSGGYDEHGYNLAVCNRYRGFSADLEWGTETFDYNLYEDEFGRKGWRVQLGSFLVKRRIELGARYAQIERLREPTYQKAMESGLGVALVRDPEGDYQSAIERRITETSVALALYLNQWHQHKLVFDASRLVREFAADPAAGIATAPDQVDYRLRSMVQLKF